MSKIKKKKLVLGITGGIATGKTTVMNMLAKAGVPTLSADDLAHECIRRGRPAYRAIVRRFGREILASDRRIDRSKLGRLVFADPARRKFLEKIVHPCVARGLRRFIRSHKGMMALDIPLLFEAKYDSWVNTIIVVRSSKTQQIRRFMSRTGSTRREALQRIGAQMSLAAKCRRADIVLDNTGAPAALRNQVRRLLSDLKRT